MATDEYWLSAFYSHQGQEKPDQPDDSWDPGDIWLDYPGYGGGGDMWNGLPSGWWGSGMLNDNLIPNPYAVPGADGPTGVNQPQPSEFTSYVTWVKFADTPTSGMSDSPEGKALIGLSTDHDIMETRESINYDAYVWGAANSTTGLLDVHGNYTWVKYSTDPQGVVGFSDDPSGKTYIGLALNNPTDVKSSNPADYVWSPIDRPVMAGYDLDYTFPGLYSVAQATKVGGWAEYYYAGWYGPGTDLYMPVGWHMAAHTQGVVIDPFTEADWLVSQSQGLSGETPSSLWLQLVDWWQDKFYFSGYTDFVNMYLVNNKVQEGAFPPWIMVAPGEQFAAKIHVLAEWHAGFEEMAPNYGAAMGVDWYGEPDPVSGMPALIGTSTGSDHGLLPDCPFIFSRPGQPSVTPDPTSSVGPRSYWAVPTARFTAPAGAVMAKPFVKLRVDAWDYHLYSAFFGKVT